MTTLFLAHTPHATASAQTLRQVLQAQGYTCWCPPGYATPAMHAYARIIEDGILGSAALVLLWDASAARDDQVTQHVLFAQRLCKPVIPVLLDQTALPTTLIVPASVAGPPASSATVAQLLALLPAARSADPLLICAEKAAQESISARKTAIELAAALLARNEHRAEVLALLAYLARHDLMAGVREKAQAALDAEAQRQAGPQAAPLLLHPEDARHIFPVTCNHCGQISYFDKRRVCSAQGTIILRQARRSEKKELDTLELPCAHCPNSIVALVDCEGY